MKKGIAVILVVVMVFCLVLLTCGCNTTITNAETITDAERYLTVTAPIDNGLTLVDSFTDNKYNYFFIDLGYAKNVPISPGVAVEYNGQTPITVSFEKRTITEESVSKALTKAVSESVSVTSMGSATFEVNQKFKYVVGETSVGASYSRQWGTVTDKSNSTSNTYETAVSQAEEQSTALTYTVGENDEKKGFYRLSLMGTCDIYAVVQTSRDNSSVINISYTLSARDDLKYRLEYDDDGQFDCSTDNIELPDNYYLTLPIPTRQAEMSSSEDNVYDSEPWYMIAVTMDRYNCKDGSKYNKSKPDSSARHSGFEIGELKLYGCRQDGESYKLCSFEDFAIRYEVLENINDLPRNDCKLAHIQDDSANRVLGTNIDSRIGYGAYWVRITYSDDSQVQYNGTNMLKYAGEGTVIDLLSADELNSSKRVKKIDVVVAYELYAGAPGVFFGIWWHEYTNWRCEYTYEFN